MKTMLQGVGMALATGRRTTLLALALLPWLALSTWADHSILRMRSVDGPVLVAVYSPPTLSSAAPVDLAVSVQDRDTGLLIPDADIEMEFTPPAGSAPRPMDVFCGPQEQLPPAFRGAGGPASRPVRARTDWPGSRILPGVRIRLPLEGRWTLSLRVRTGTHRVEVQDVLPVQGSAGRLRAVWPSLALPPMAIVLFAVNRRLRRSPLPAVRPD